MICYDIFNLADFPIIITDRNFVIQHKNNIAKRFFSNFRKSSRITLHTDELNKDTDLSEPIEIQFTKGTQFKRALVFLYDDETVFFVFFSNLQLENSKVMLERVKDQFKGNFFDFYTSAYNAYKESQNYFENSSPIRLLDDLLLLMKVSRDKLSFMNRDIFDMAEVLELVCSKAGSSLASLGFKISAVTMLDNARKFCFCKINIDDFLFVLFKMIYVCLTFSDNKCIAPSLEYCQEGYAKIRLQTKACSKICNDESDAFHIISDLSELSMEVAVLKKMHAFEKTTSCNIKDGFLNIEFKIQCTTGFDSLLLRSDLTKNRKKATLRAISANISTLKKMLSRSL